MSERKTLDQLFLKMTTVLPLDRKLIYISMICSQLDTLFSIVCDMKMAYITVHKTDAFIASVKDERQSKS